MDEKTMRENITRARVKRGLSKKAVADGIGLSRVSVTALEKGPTNIVNEHIPPMAKFLGVSLDELLLGYVPDPDSAGRLEQERADYGLKKASLIAEYEEKLSSAERENTALRSLVESQKETIRGQEEIIKMLRRRIPEEND